MDTEIARIQPVGRQLDPAQDQLLARYCYILALFEEEYRSGRPFGPLHEPPEKNSVEELLACAPHLCVDDIVQLAGLFLQQQAALLNGAFTLNPHFAGSGDVGGADADLIVDGCLFEFKTTKLTHP